MDTKKKNPSYLDESPVEVLCDFIKKCHIDQGSDFFTACQNALSVVDENEKHLVIECIISKFDVKEESTNTPESKPSEDYGDTINNEIDQTKILDLYNFLILKLQTSKQGYGESVTEYAKGFLTCLIDIHSIMHLIIILRNDLPEHRAALAELAPYCFIEGLCPEIKYIMLDRNPGTLNNVIDLALEIESLERKPRIDICKYCLAFGRYEDWDSSENEDADDEDDYCNCCRDYEDYLYKSSELSNSKVRTV